jgi:serine/threonine protein kinase
MMDAERCPSCGHGLDVAAPDCPVCTASLSPGDAVTAITLVTRAERVDRRRVERLALSEEFRTLYRLERCLGAGGNGMVFRATQLSMGRPVAVKFMSHLADSGLRERFVREGRLLARVKHPRIVGVIELGAVGGHPYLVTELLPGPTLRARLREGRMEPAAALDVARDLAAALAACHEAGIVHRDVKPENVMFGADGRARLLDLGLARYAEAGAAVTHEGMVLGTPRYMAPEQAGGGEVTAASDLYALGCVAFEMLAGRSPFVNPNMFEMIQAHVRQPAPDLAELAPRAPAGMVAAVARCLEKDPARRPESAAALAALLAASAGEAVAAVPPAPRPVPSNVKTPRIETAADSHDTLTRDTAPPARARGPAAVALTVLGSLGIALLVARPGAPPAPSPPQKASAQSTIVLSAGGSAPVTSPTSPTGAALPQGCRRRVPDLWAIHGDLNVLAVTDDGNLVASGANDGSLKMWDRRARRLLWSARTGFSVFHLQFTSDGTRLISAHRDRNRLLALNDTTYRTWDAWRGGEVGEPVGLGPLLLRGENLPNLVEFEGAFRIARGRVRERLPGRVLALGATLAPAGGLIAVREPAALALWHPGASKPVWRVPRPAIEARVDVQFCGDATRLVVREGTSATVHRVSDGAPLCTVKDATRLSFSRDGRVLAVGENSSPYTRFLDAATGAEVAPRHNFDAEFALAEGGRVVMLGVYDRIGYMELVNGAWRETESPFASNAMAVGADAGWAILREIGPTLRYDLWDRASDTRRTFPPVDVGVAEMRVSPYAPEALGLSFLDGKIRHARVFDVATTRITLRMQLPEHEMLRPAEVAWFYITPAGIIERANGSRREPVGKLPHELVHRLTTSSSTGIGHLARFDRTGTWLAIAGPYGSVELLELATGRVRALVGENIVELDRSGWHKENEPPLAFTRDSRHLFCQTSRNELHQVEVATGARVRRFRGAAVHATAVALSTDEKLLAAGYDDGAIHVWYVPTGRPVASFQSGAGIVRHLGVDSTAGVVLSIGRDRALLEWVLPAVR